MKYFFFFFLNTLALWSQDKLIDSRSEVVVAAHYAINFGEISKFSSTLRIGENSSSFRVFTSNNRNTSYDSIPESEYKTSKYNYISTETDMVVNKYLNEGVIVYREQEPTEFKYYIVKDALKIFDWIIKDEFIDYKGLRLQKAVCKFRGREYVAHFANDIKYSDGPWKFNGLPGLIIKIKSTDNFFSAELDSIEFFAEDLSYWELKDELIGYNSYKRLAQEKYLQRFKDMKKRKLDKSNFLRQISYVEVIEKDIYSSINLEIKKLLKSQQREIELNNRKNEVQN